MAQVLQKKQIASGKWIYLQEITWRGHDNVDRVWEAVGRVHSAGAVMMIPILSDGRIIIIRQFRPPVGGYIYEFPAGLINPGESPAETAVRELKEETGYIGRIVTCTPAAYTSPGLSSECVYIAEMYVDLAEQGDLDTHFDESENIETFLIEPKDLPEFLKKADIEGNKVDSKIFMWMLAQKH